MNRSMAREIAMKRLYAHLMGGDGDNAAMMILSEPEESEKKIALSKPDRVLADAIFDGVLEKREDLDARIAALSTGWSLERMDAVDVCLLRMATLEMLYFDQIPVGASINEAVELAKTFGGEKSASFVNGVLGALSRLYPIAAENQNSE